MTNTNLYILIMETVKHMKDGEKLECRDCAWCTDMSDCETEGDFPGQHDLCGCVNDVEMIADELDGNKVDYIRNIRCISHRRRGPIWARLEKWCGKEARWFKEKTNEVVA